MQARKDIASSVVVLMFGAVFLVYASRYPVDTLASPGPGAFPLMAGGAVVLLGFWQFLLSFWKWRRAEKTGIPSRDGAPAEGSLRESPGARAAVFLVAAFVLYVLCIRWIGYFVSTFVFVIYVSRLSESRDFRRPILLSAGINLFSYLVFVRWLKLSFPGGLLF
jgi:hypothetical protein